MILRTFAGILPNTGRVGRFQNRVKMSPLQLFCISSSWLYEVLCVRSPFLDTVSWYELLVTWRGCYNKGSFNQFSVTGN